MARSECGSMANPPETQWIRHLRSHKPASRWHHLRCAANLPFRSRNEFRQDRTMSSQDLLLMLRSVASGVPGAGMPFSTVLSLAKALYSSDCFTVSTAICRFSWRLHQVSSSASGSGRFSCRGGGFATAFAEAAATSARLRRVALAPVHKFVGALFRVMRRLVREGRDDVSEGTPVLQESSLLSDSIAASTSSGLGSASPEKTGTGGFADCVATAGALVAGIVPVITGAPVICAEAPTGGMTGTIMTGMKTVPAGALDQVGDAVVVPIGQACGDGQKTIPGIGCGSTIGCAGPDELAGMSHGAVLAAS